MVRPVANRISCRALARTKLEIVGGIAPAPVISGDVFEHQAFGERRNSRASFHQPRAWDKRVGHRVLL